jgi:plastocyanin
LRLGWRNATLLAAPVFLAAAVLAVAPASAGGGRPKPDERVVVQDNFFTARSVTIASGDVVRWVWRGSNRHNIVFKHVPRGAARKGASARRKGRWQRAFREPGKYRYVCTLFTGMRGSIMVEQPPAE